MTQRDLGAELVAAHGLTRKDFEALFLLARAEGQRMKRVELAERLSLTPSGVTRLLEGLERDGLVERAACDTDLRVSYAALTDAGRAKFEAASCGHEGSVRSLFEEHLTGEEIEALAEILAKLPGTTEDDGSACPGA